MRSRQLDAALTRATSRRPPSTCAPRWPTAPRCRSSSARRLRAGEARRPLYCYRALTGEFIGEREPALKRLPGHAEAAKLLERFDGLDRYLASVGGEAARAKGRARVRAAIKALLEEVFDEQTDFELRAERVAGRADAPAATRRSPTRAS